MEAHIDPDVSDLLVDDVGVDAIRHRFDFLLALNGLVCDRNEERRGEQSQLQPLLAAIEEDSPGTAWVVAGGVTHGGDSQQGLIWTECITNHK